TREVAGAVTADLRWRSILADPDARRRRAARRALARALGDLFRRLHAAGLYHNDLKDVNLLTHGPPAAPHLVLLDLERVRALGRVGRRRRVKNLVQLARTLGRQASATDRVRFLAAYLGGTSTRAERRPWAAAVVRRARRKDRGRRPAPSPRAWRASPSRGSSATSAAGGTGATGTRAAWCAWCGARRRAGVGRIRTSGPR